MTENMEQKPRIKRESKNKIRVEFERTSLRERLKEKYLSLYFLKRAVWYVFRLLLPLKWKIWWPNAKLNLPKATAFLLQHLPKKWRKI